MLTETENQTLSLHDLNQQIAALKSKRAALVKDHAQQIEHIRVLLITAGQDIRNRYRYPWNLYPAFEWKSHKVSAQLFERYGNFFYDGQSMVPETTQRINITVTGHQVCRVVITNRHKTITEIEADLFIPGKWLNEIMPVARAVIAEINQDKIKQATTELERLQAEMLQGIEI